MEEHHDAVFGRDPVNDHRRFLALEPEIWPLAWLRLHRTARELLKMSPAAPEWPEVKRGLADCAELRREIVAAGWFN